MQRGWVQCANTVGAHSLLWVRRRTAERPGRLRVCRFLSGNKLNGRVPSSLSALMNLAALCVARFLPRRLHVRPRRVGSVRLCSERAACERAACLQCAGVVGAHSLLWVRRSTAERPSRLRVCSDLSSNALTGSVPSSLSALTNLDTLCVARFLPRRLRVRPRRVGSVRLYSERAACRGWHVWCIERGGAAAGLLRYSQRGPVHVM
jgi:hypothetical protein